MKTKKKPSDYPQMAFRISPQDKAKLEQIIDRLHKEINERVAPDDFKVKKNDIIVDALFNGLLYLGKGNNYKRLLGR